MLGFFKKKIRDDQEKTLETNIKAYIVWWNSGERFTSDTWRVKARCRAFVDKQEAEEYKKVLEYCFLELGFTAHYKVRIEEQYG